MEYTQLNSILILGVGVTILFYILSYIFLGIWIYRDSKLREQNYLPWLIVLIFIPNIIIVISYLILRKDKKYKCLYCDNIVSKNDSYCISCGKEIGSTLKLKSKGNVKYVIIGIISSFIVFISIIFTFIIGFSIYIVEGNINSNYKDGNNWSFTLKDTIQENIKEEKFIISDARNERLFLNLSCNLIDSNGTITLWIEQGENVKKIDIDNFENTLIYSLREFEEGEITVKFEMNNVKNVKVLTFIAY